MKKMIGLLAMTILSSHSFCQETLQSVTINGNTTTRALIVNKDDGDYGLNASNGVDADVLIGATIPNASLKYGWIQSSFNGRSLILNPNNGANVGIGTTSPAYKLDVNGAGRFHRSGDNDFLILDHQGTQTWRHGISTSNTSTYVISNDLGGESANKVLALTHAGNVGIGTTSPAYKLDVNGSILARAELLSSVDEDGGGRLTLVNPRKSESGTASVWRIFNMTGAYGNSLQFWAYDNQGCSGGLCNNRLTLADDGNVGIGTASPTQKLEIAGAIKSYDAGFGVIGGITSPVSYANFGSNNHGSVLISANLYMSGNDNLKIANSHATMSGSAILIPGNGQPNQNSIAFYTQSPNPVTAEQNYNGTPRMLISASGNVGIGTTAPQSELAVKGTITSTKVKVTQTGWADYVFDSSYQLAPLSHVETFIKENKHLPEVPSATEVKKDGLDLGDNQAVLLKKIEELTLYIIQQNKKIEHMGKELEEVKTIQRNSGQR